MAIPVTPQARERTAAALRAAGCVFAEEEADLLFAGADSTEQLDRMISERASGTPLEYVVGWAEFCGLRIAVEAPVFVPRRRTGLLVAQALERIRALSRPVAVDLCCGSGAVGAALLAGVSRPPRRGREKLELYACDIDPAAVRCARANIAPARVFEGDLFEALPRALEGRLDVVVANAPYVATQDLPFMPREARLHERRVALDGGVDGTLVQRRIADSAARWLSPRGTLLVETSARQVARTLEIFSDRGLTCAVATSEELEATVVIGDRRPGGGGS